MTTADTLGKRIARARLLAGAARGKPYTQTELARVVGVTPPTVSQWESGASEPALDTITRIAAALHVTPSYLAFGEGQSSAPRKLTDAEIEAARARVAARRAADKPRADDPAPAEPPRRAAGDGKGKRRPPGPR